MQDKRWAPSRYSKTEKRRIVTCEELLTWTNYPDMANKDILDVGCGHGAIDNYLSKKYPGVSIITIDSSEEMINYAKETFRQEVSLNFQLMRAEEINFNKQFDYVISLACLHWVKEQDKFLSNVYKVLKSGGHALFSLNPQQPYLWKAVTQLIKQATWENFFKSFNHGYNFYNKESYTTFAEAVGFYVGKIEIVNDPLNINTSKEFETLISGWLPHIAHLPDNLINLFLSEITQNMLIMMKKDGIQDFSEYEGISLKVHLIKP